MVKYFSEKESTTLFRRQRDTSTVKKANDNLKILNIIFMTQNQYFTANQGDMFLDILTPMLPFPSKICFCFWMRSTFPILLIPHYH